MTAAEPAIEVVAAERAGTSDRSGARGRIWAVARVDLLIIRNDPAFLLVFTVMPLAFMAFNTRAIGAALSLQFPDLDASGASFVVPGATVLFSGFLVGNIGFAIFREHGWGTWERLRSSPLSSGELMLAKSLAPIVTIAIQIASLLVGGWLLFGLEVRGSVTAFVLVSVALGVMEVALGFMLLSLCTSVVQLNALSNAGAMLLGGLGGATTPVEFLPGWAQAIAPATPAYWAMKGFRRVTLEAGGIGDVIAPIAVLLAFAVAFAVVAVLRFRVEETKVSWA